MKMVSVRYHGGRKPARTQATPVKIVRPVDHARSVSSPLGKGLFLLLFLLFLQLFLRSRNFFTRREPRILSCQAPHLHSMGCFFIRDSLLWGGFYSMHSWQGPQVPVALQDHTSLWGSLGIGPGALFLLSEVHGHNLKVCAFLGHDVQ